MSNPSASNASSSPTRKRDWLRPPRHLALTTSGKFFVLMTLAVGFGAINTGNNLLFLLLGMMLSLIVASGLLSEAVLRTLRVKRDLPARVFAGEPAAGRFVLENRGRWPSLSVEVSEHSAHATAGPQRGRSLAQARHAWWKMWRTQTSDDVRPLAAAYCLRADSGRETSVATHYVVPARGAYALPGVQISTRFPFGFFEKTREIDQEQQLIVYPRSRPTKAWVARLNQQLGDMSQSRAGRGDDFFGLRDYREGEDQRSIHWKSTARRGAPVVRELESNDRRDVAILLDNRASSDLPSTQERQIFERGVEHLAGLLESLVAAGFRVQLRAASRAAQEDSPRAINDLDAMLTLLALIELLPASAAAPSAPPADPGERRPALVHVGFHGAASSAEGSATLSFDDLTRAGDDPEKDAA